MGNNFHEIYCKQSISKFVNKLVNSTIWLIIDKLYPARQFYQLLLEIFYNITFLEADEENLLINRFLLSLQRLQSALFQQRSEYYLEELLVNMLALMPKVHSLMSWKLGQTWGRLNLMRDFELCLGNPLNFSPQLNELTDCMLQSEIIDICADVLNS